MKNNTIYKLILGAGIFAGIGVLEYNIMKNKSPEEKYAIAFIEILNGAFVYAGAKGISILAKDINKLEKQLQK